MEDSDILESAMAAFVADETQTADDVTEESAEVAPEASEEAAHEEEPEEAEKEPEEAEKERKALETREAELLERDRKIDRKYQDLRQKSEKINARLRDWKQEKSRLEAEVQSIRADANLLRTGDARGILSTLAKLTGRDAVDVYREMGEALATDGAAAKSKSEPKIPKELEERLARIDALEAAERARQAQAQNLHVVRQVGTALAEEVSSGERYPSLAAYAAANGGPQKAAQELLQQMFLVKRNEGRDITVDEICAIAEYRLSSRKPGPDTSETGGGPDTAATIASDGDLGAETPGASLSPSASTATTGQKRPLTAEERERAALKKIPSLLAEWGF